MALEVLQIDGEDVLVDGETITFGDTTPYEETIAHLHTQQLVQVVGSVEQNVALLGAQQSVTVVSQHEFEQVIFTGQVITVVQEMRIYPRRRNFMGFGPG